MPIPPPIIAAGFFSHDSFHYRAYRVFPVPVLMVIITYYLFENYLIRVSRSNECETP
jgi:H+/gluconate symporter-like permease